MKLLKKLLLIHWHYFSHEVIEFDKINFLTGKNASGKSTIIDALQLVFLADTSGNYFNKAANGKSSRTLSGYLRGELGDDGDTGVRCLRNDRFTSYIAVEFFDDVKQTYFTAGCCFDFYSAGDIPRMFFRFDGSIPQSEFLNHRVPMDIKALRQYIKTQYPASKGYTTETNRDFKEDFYGRLGGLQNRFGELLRKAVPFDPIADIKDFITKFVCEEEQNVDISLMQENIRNYKNLENEAAALEERKDHLLKIIETYESYKSFKGQENLYDYLIKRAQLEGKIVDFEKNKKLYVDNENELSDIGLEITKLTNEKNVVNDECNSKIADLKNNAINKTVEDLERRQKECRQQIAEIEKLYVKFQDVLKHTIFDWERRMQIVNGLSKSNELAILPTALQERIKSCEENALALLMDVKPLTASGYTEINNIGTHKLNTYASRGQALAKNATGIWERLGDEQSIFANKKMELDKEQKLLKKGIFQFPQTVIDLREAVFGELSSRFGIHVKVSIVAEIIEIKSERWRNSIEGYLNNQKYNIIVAPENFISALLIYNRIKDQKKIYGVGIVDIASIIQKQPKCYPGSLAEEIETNDKYAKAYMNYLLGRVMKCDQVDELQKHSISITDEGMLYQGYVARRINPLHWEKAVIGRTAIQRRLKLIEVEIEKYYDASVSCALLKNKFETLKELALLSASDIDMIIETAKEYDKIPFLSQEVELIDKELTSIDKSPLLVLQESINNLKEKIDQYEEELDGFKKKAGAKENENENIETGIIPLLNNEIEEKSSLLSSLFESEWVEKTGTPRYEKEAFSKEPAEIERNFYSAYRKAEGNRRDRWTNLRDLRKEYNSAYKKGFNEDALDNDEYDDAWLELSEIQLPGYIAKIEDARRKAFEQFQEDFLSRLQFNIKAAETHIRQLNEALKGYSFGEDQYQFKIIPKQEYKRFYSMITDNMLLESGYNLLSIQYNEKYKEEIKELFSIITDTGSGSRLQEREEYERRVQEFTNYRTYLSFDLEVMAPDGEIQRLSKTLGKKSGGETQTPFYIAVLASFAQLYRLGRDKNANTARIIIFDEAFSKMDGERIVQSIDLLRKFDFQVILSAPSDKIGDIAPLVDRNLCVLREDKRIFVKSFLPRQLGEI